MSVNDEQNYRQFIKDLSVLDAFHLRKSSEYFNAAASKSANPADYQTLADAMEKLATVQDRLSQPNPPLFELLKADADLTAQIDTLLEKSGEADASRTYALSKMAEFVAAEPEAWNRLVKRRDPFTEKAKTYLK